MKSSEMAAQISSIADMMRRNQLTALEYLDILKKLDDSYIRAIQSAKKEGDHKRSQLLHVKKDIVGREVSYAG